MKLLIKILTKKLIIIFVWNYDKLNNIESRLHSNKVNILNVFIIVIILNT